MHLMPNLHLFSQHKLYWPQKPQSTDYKITRFYQILMKKKKLFI